jgi:hypothetical protein
MRHQRHSHPTHLLCKGRFPAMLPKHSLCIIFGHIVSVKQPALGTIRKARSATTTTTNRSAPTTLEPINYNLKQPRTFATTVQYLLSIFLQDHKLQDLSAQLPFTETATTAVTVLMRLVVQLGKQEAPVRLRPIGLLEEVHGSSVCRTPSPKSYKIGQSTSYPLPCWVMRNSTVGIQSLAQRAHDTQLLHIVTLTPSGLLGSALRYRGKCVWLHAPHPTLCDDLQQQA